uniref:Uncharacterized protein n=1 Tax=Salix viminalis TaxID=40686 RepID=A0A6N2NE27_SALVM
MKFAALRTDASTARGMAPHADKNSVGFKYVVVTILVAAKGVYQVPAIRSTEDMKGALRSLNVDAKELEVRCSGLRRMRMIHCPSRNFSDLNEKYAQYKPGLQLDLCHIPR